MFIKIEFNYYKNIIVILVLILQFINVFSHASQDVHNPRIYENEDIVVYLDSVTGNVILTDVKKINDNTFPNHIIINGIDTPISIIEPMEPTRYYVGWPQEKPDTLIVPDGIREIGNNFTVYLWKHPMSQYRNLRCIRFPNTLESIGSYAFNHNHFKDLTIPPSVIDIRPEAFTMCTIDKLDLGKVQSIGSSAFYNCKNLKWVKIPNETRIIGLEAFNLYRPVFFLQLSPVDINPVINFANTFGTSKIPYIACVSEFLNPSIKARYQSDMPEVFDNRAMIHLESSPVPLYFSFEETEENEGLWEPGIDLWAQIGKRSKHKRKSKEEPSENTSMSFYPKYSIDIKKINIDCSTLSENQTKEKEPKDPASELQSGVEYNFLLYPVSFRIDTSSLPRNKRTKLRVLYNDKDITDSVIDNSFTIIFAKPFNNKDFKSGSEPIYNRIRIILEV